ncbi:MAG: hypothetical protein P8J33_13795 [Pirellulaceae bacterium]|nr:hypothetical protein [Pirellulaceae bacterium]
MSQKYRKAIELIQAQQWDQAHEIVQHQREEVACWIHGWLHRKEGDEANARYWYTAAGKPYPDLCLDEEWVQIQAWLTDADS